MKLAFPNNLDQPAVPVLDVMRQGSSVTRWVLCRTYMASRRGRPDLLKDLIASRSARARAIRANCRSVSRPF